MEGTDNGAAKHVHHSVGQGDDVAHSGAGIFAVWAGVIVKNHCGLFLEVSWF